jgi:hypothetical protein
MTTEKHKQCFKCGESKPLSAFYKHPRMADGHLNKCKECNKKDVRENRMSNLDYYIEFDRKRNKDHEGLRYRNQLEVTSKRMRKKFPEKYKARQAIANALRKGIIYRPTNCEHCGKECKPNAHHSSYSEGMELAVTWLCYTCHGEVHRLYDYD